MARLHYHRWINQFVIDKFSSEDSMRDYLSSNPALIFEDDEYVIPIVEEKHLPKSSLDKNAGRADIIICRIIRDNKLDMSNIEVWILELKKDEASYQNGFEQLFDYMLIMRDDEAIKRDIQNIIKQKIQSETGKSIEIARDAPMTICGAIVAPSFDLVGRTEKTRFPILNTEMLSARKLGEGFTLFDAINASRKIFQMSLIKLIRFRRGDEIIMYSENALGQKAAREIKRVDPIELFNQGLLNENDEFYFRDNGGTEHSAVRCKVMNKKGQSHSFILRIENIPNYENKDVPLPKWTKSGYDWKRVKKVPIEETAKTCSIVLHKIICTDYDDEYLFRNYGSFGDKNFVRKSDKKDLSELRSELRDNDS